MKKSHAIGILSAAALTYSVAPTYAHKLCHRLRRPSADSRTLYLTFDDGPDPHYTPELLDLLDQYDIKASFFVVARFAQQNPALLHRMQRSGHLIGLHSLCHKNGMLQPPHDAFQDFAQAVDILHHLGVPVRYYRPPWGHWNVVSLAQLHRFRMKPVLWDVMAQDWRADITAPEIAARLIGRTAGGDIVCLHDGRGKDGAPARTIVALRRVLPYCLAHGYRFDTVDHRDE